MRFTVLLSGAVLCACASCSTLRQAPPAHADILIDDTAVYPESMDAAPDGTVYVGSIKGTVFRAAPGADRAEPWVAPSPANGILALFGVLVDAPHGTLWLCSTPTPLTRPPKVGISALLALDLATGTLRGRYPLPPPASVCNDITIARDGTAFASDTANGRIFTLSPGARELQLFASDPRLKGIDGIVFGADGTLYANIVSRNRLVRIARHADGSFADVVELATSQPVLAPDGFRLIAGNRFLLAEGNGGRVDEVTIEGDAARVRVLRAGLVSPPGVAHAGRTAYAIEGKIGYLFDPRLRGKDPGPFRVYELPLPPSME
ncbi:MAG TPA: hypothetical protein VMB48_04700 [Steroidobacteraceae bacterium]|nr:hypothetical protein [Steroidobacteraceae bacterium]